MRAAHIGCAAWPELGLDAAQFCQELAARVETVPDASRYTEQVVRNAADLFLAAACARGSVSAIQIFEQEYIDKTAHIVRRYRLSETQLTELTQRLRVHVLLRAGTNPPRINQYTGRGRLFDWFRVLALRTATDLCREQARYDAVTANASIEVVLQQQMTSRGEPEEQLLRTRFKSEYEAAVRAALQRLDPDSRNILKLHFAKGLNGAQIGALLGVNRSTVMRRLEKVQEDLRAAVYEHLITVLHLSPSELQSLTHQLRSQLSISLSDLLSVSE